MVNEYRISTQVLKFKEYEHCNLINEAIRLFYKRLYLNHTIRYDGEIKSIGRLGEFNVWKYFLQQDRLTRPSKYVNNSYFSTTTEKPITFDFQEFATDYRKIFDKQTLKIDFFKLPPLTFYGLITLLFIISLLSALLSVISIKVQAGRKEPLDTFFTAGGRVSAGLTATQIISKWMPLSTITTPGAHFALSGIGAVFWAVTGYFVQLIFTALISLQFKVTAPGAKTFLQAIQARYSKRTHIFFIAFSVLTNIIYATFLIAEGAVLIEEVTEDTSSIIAALLLIILSACFISIAGFGGIVYFSYVNVAVIFCVCFYISYIIFHGYNQDIYTLPNARLPQQCVGDYSHIYKLLNCLKSANENNYKNSLLTVFTADGAWYGAITFFSTLGMSFVDQSFWQNGISTRPRKLVEGFIIGGMAFYPLSMLMGIASGSAFVSLQYWQYVGYDVLTDINDALNKSNATDVVNNIRRSLPDLSLVDPIEYSTSKLEIGNLFLAAANLLYGSIGSKLVMVIAMFSVPATVSSELLAIASIMVYDVYSTYIMPFRVVKSFQTCILCGKDRNFYTRQQERQNELQYGQTPHDVLPIDNSLMTKSHSPTRDRKKTKSNKKKARAKRMSCEDRNNLKVRRDHAEASDTLDIDTPSLHDTAQSSDAELPDTSYHDSNILKTARQRLRMRMKKSKICTCESVTHCLACEEDYRYEELYNPRKDGFTVKVYLCPMHGAYREYTNRIIAKRKWFMFLSPVMVAVCVTIILFIGLSPPVLTSLLALLTVSAVPALAGTVFWARQTTTAVMSSVICGSICSFLAWIISSYQYALNTNRQFKLKDLINTKAFVIGCISGLSVSTFLDIFVTFIQTNSYIQHLYDFIRNRRHNVSIKHIIFNYHSELNTKYNVDVKNEVWNRTRDIDNALRPWTEILSDDFNVGLKSYELGQRPSYRHCENQVSNLFRMTTLTFICCTSIIVIIWPLVEYIINDFYGAEAVMGRISFHFIIIFFESWLMIAAVYCVISPIFYEGVVLYQSHKYRQNLNLQDGMMDIEDLPNDSLSPSELPNIESID
ncbi:hypothetical protein SNEBB_011039 [Seison nebaliae]|nr:hypothetical protein SNEBB_011039 [Seison nebaliae]